MNTMLPSQSLSLLKNMINSKIIKVKRQIYKPDMNLENFQQDADGPIEIRLDNGTIINFQALTELNSIGVGDGKMPIYGESYSYMDVSNNSFWLNRIGQGIQQVYIIQSEFNSMESPNEFSIEILFDNNTQVCIEYCDEEDIPDTIRLINKCVEPKCLRIAVNN